MITHIRRNNIDISMGEFTKSTRYKLNMNQSEFAKVLGLGSYTRVGEYERNVRTPTKLTASIIQLLHDGKLDPYELIVHNSKSKYIMPYDKWYDINQAHILINLAESGAAREMDFDLEREFDSRYLKYLTEGNNNG